MEAKCASASAPVLMNPAPTPDISAIVATRSRPRACLKVIGLPRSFNWLTTYPAFHSADSPSMLASPHGSVPAQTIAPRISNASVGNLFKSVSGRAGPGIALQWSSPSVPFETQTTRVRRPESRSIAYKYSAQSSPPVAPANNQPSGAFGCTSSTGKPSGVRIFSPQAVKTPAARTVAMNFSSVSKQLLRRIRSERT